ncbi:Uncharacterised protein [Actinobacillus equuli]|nr:Uncharacterised protein [Actinobacillus equuli]
MKYSTLLTSAAMSMFLAMNAYAEGNQIKPTVEHKTVTKNAPLSAKRSINNVLTTVLRYVFRL